MKFIGRHNIIGISTYWTSLPSVRDTRHYSVDANHSSHFFDSWVRRDNIVKWQLILVVYPADVTSPADFPQDETESVDVGPFEGIKVVHVH